jgi:hypothetical protein
MLLQALCLSLICSLLTLYAYKVTVRFGGTSSLVQLRQTPPESDVVSESDADADTPYSDSILRRVDKWACVKGCGACCKLGPIESRPDLEEYLTPDEFTLYGTMIGEDDWCVNFDKETRMCKIYEDRLVMKSLGPSLPKLLPHYCLTTASLLPRYCLTTASLTTTSP